MLSSEGILGFTIYTEVLTHPELTFVCDVNCWYNLSFHDGQTVQAQGGVLQREIKLLSPWRHLITSQDAEVETFPFPPQISIFTLQSKSCFFCHQRAEGQMRKPPYMSCKFIVLGFLLQVTNPNICTGHTWLSLQYLGMKN